MLLLHVNGLAKMELWHFRTQSCQQPSLGLFSAEHATISLEHPSDSIRLGWKSNHISLHTRKGSCISCVTSQNRVVAPPSLSLLARHYRLQFRAGFALFSCNEVRHGGGWCEQCHNTHYKEKNYHWKGQASHLHSALSKELDMRFSSKVLHWLKPHVIVYPAMMVVVMCQRKSS